MDNNRNTINSSGRITADDLRRKLQRPRAQSTGTGTARNTSAQNASRPAVNTAARQKLSDDVFEYDFVEKPVSDSAKAKPVQPVQKETVRTAAPEKVVSKGQDDDFLVFNSESGTASSPAAERPSGQGQILTQRRQAIANAIAGERRAQPQQSASRPAPRNTNQRPVQSSRRAPVQQSGGNRPTFLPQKKSKESSTGKKIVKNILRVLLVILTVIVVFAAVVLVSLRLICSNISPAAKNMFVTTILETGQLKFLASWFVSQEEIKQIVDQNKMEDFDREIDDSLINIGSKGSIVAGQTETGEEEDIQVIEISGTTYYANLIIVKDPSRVSVATIYPWRDVGVTLDKLVKDSGAIGGINGGLYNSYNNSGGSAYGVVVSNGEIQMNEPNQWPGLVLIGLTEDNILQIINIEGMSPADVEYMIKDKKIRDAVTFQEENSDSNNHFVQLILNGEAREMGGKGSGLNPRTVIGQRADGAILMLVTDGRGKGGHLGASASDLVNIMLEYGAVNAANLDGGSSSCMYYNDEWLMTSVTFYYSNASWNLPLAFVIK